MTSPSRERVQWEPEWGSQLKAATTGGTRLTQGRSISDRRARDLASRPRSRSYFGSELPTKSYIPLLAASWQEKNELTAQDVDEAQDASRKSDLRRVRTNLPPFTLKGRASSLLCSIPLPVISLGADSGNPLKFL